MMEIEEIFKSLIEIPSISKCLQKEIDTEILILKKNATNNEEPEGASGQRKFFDLLEILESKKKVSSPEFQQF